MFENIKSSTFKSSKNWGYCNKAGILKVKAYFEDIHQIILEAIKNATTEIKVAVAWFTDRELFDALCKRVTQGVLINVVLIDDKINRGAGRLNFIRLQNLGASVRFIEEQHYTKMHHKFCIIDQKIVITGSYNWTNQARSNAENITVIEDAPIIVDDYLAIFNKLIADETLPATVQISADTVRRRLEMIKNFILLDEIEDIPAQIQKIKPAIGAYKLDNIVESLENGQYQQAAETIEDYLKRLTAIVVSEDYESAELKFELKILELRLESVTNEQADLERYILLFNRKQYEILGDITEKVLQAKARYMRLKAEQAREEQLHDKEDVEAFEQEAEQAEQTYQEYADEHEAVLQTQVQSLSEEEEKDLKQLFRKCCNLCHPDKVPDTLKEQAHEIFIQVKEAYDNNDLAKVEEIYQRLKSGNFSQTKSSTLKAIDVLRSAVAELRYKLDQAIAELHKLKALPVTKLFEEIGYAESEWERYLEGKRQIMEDQLIHWQSLEEGLK